MAKPVNKPFSMRLPEETRAELQTLAQSKGLTESDLGRMFIVEKLAEHQSSALVPLDYIRRCHAVNIAANSDQLDYVDALELLSQYLDSSTQVTQ